MNIKLKPPAPLSEQDAIDELLRLFKALHKPNTNSIYMEFQVKNAMSDTASLLPPGPLKVVLLGDLVLNHVKDDVAVVHVDGEESVNAESLVHDQVGGH